MLTAAFRGHGTFFYNSEASLRKFGNDADQLVSAMQKAGMAHGWVRLHSWNKSTQKPSVEPFQSTLKLIQALRVGGIHVAGWGWNQGVDPLLDAEVASEQLERYGLVDYIADIEHGHSDAVWSFSAVETYFKRLRLNLSKPSNVALSTFGFIGVHEPSLMRAAEPYVDAFAPQIYWFNHPQNWMRNRPDLPHGAAYKLHDPESYFRMCIDMWRHYVATPLVATGQAYWGESASYTRAVSEKKLESFLDGFTDWERIAGINWWHFGHKVSNHSEGAMSPKMFAAIADAELDTKTYD